MLCHLMGNARDVLTAPGARAGLYRVLVRPDGGGVVVSRLQDSMKCIGPENVTPVVWRVAGEAGQS